MRKVTLFIALVLACMGNFRAQHITTILDSTFFYEESFVELDTSSYLTTTRLWDRAPYNLALDEFTGTPRCCAILSRCFCLTRQTIKASPDFCFN